MTDPQDQDAAFEAIVAGLDATPADEMDALAPVVFHAVPEPVPEEEEHFIPPPAPPAPRLTPEAMWGIVAIIAGVLTVFVLPYLDVIERTPWRDRMGVFAILGGGVALLVWRLRDDPHDDDGAEV